MAQYEEILHNTLTGESAVIKSNDFYTFEERKRKKQEIWDRKNTKIQGQQQVKSANKRNKKRLEDLENILLATLKIDDKINWETLLRKETFTPFSRAQAPKREILPDNFFLELIPYFKRKRKEMQQRLNEDFEKITKKFETSEEKRKKKYDDDRMKFEAAQIEYNRSIELLKEKYEAADTEAVENYFTRVLENSVYPDEISLNHEVAFVQESSLLIINTTLPSPDTISGIKEYLYVSGKDEVKSKEMSVKEFEQFYNDILLKITIRNVHEILEADYQKNVGTIVFNGWVASIDKKTGKDVNSCLISLQTDRNTFEDIQLDRVEVRECFRHLKGITAGSLINLSPVRPIMVLNRVDGRIIAADNVIDGMQDQQNLATMEWQDFEILIRDLFAKEFGTDGCEVEVTRASRDAGVDAIAFDPDPVRGGKFVLQAKRYNNLVPVSAVRDLYGTVMNEGAVKGILVTTSYFGADSMEFAKNKPLTLINGENLLYMLGKHGYKFQIELIKKAKRGSTQVY